MTIALEQQIASLYLNVKKSDVRLAGCILKMDEIFVLIDDIQVQGDDNNKNMYSSSSKQLLLQYCFPANAKEVERLL